MTAAAISDAVRAGRQTITEIIEQSLHACAADTCNAVTTIFEGRARARAAQMDAAGDTQGPLAGVPFVVKNIFDVTGHITRAGSTVTETKAPANSDAYAISALERAGAVLVAATNMDELAYGFSGENLHDGDTLNPRGEGLSAGGSSSGSAAAVAAGTVPLALGTDTNGSVRVPAALSGSVGLKPTYGRVSRQGVLPFVPSLDHVGVFAATVGDASLAFSALDQFDCNDPVATCGKAGHLEIPSVARLGGWFEHPLHSDVSDAIDDACVILNASQTVTFDLAEEARAASFVLTAAEGGQTHLSALANSPDRFGKLVRHRLMAGAMVPASWTGRAQKLRTMACDVLADLHYRSDVLIAPAAPCPAFPLGVADWSVSGIELPIRLGIGMFTQALTLTGVPILVLARRGALSGLPVGIQLIAGPHNEAMLFDVAMRLEATGFTMAPESEEFTDV